MSLVELLFTNPLLQAGAVVLAGVLTMAILESLELQANQRSWVVMFWTTMVFAVLNPLLGFFERSWWWVPASLLCGATVWFVLLFVTPRIGREQADMVPAASDPEQKVSFLPVIVWAALSGLLVLTQLTIWIVGLIRHKK